MDLQEPKVQGLNKFELYLEGIGPIQFASIQISENEGVPPATSITFPFDSGAMRVLPGTVAQLFVTLQNSKEEESDPILIFEGEAISRQYQKGAQGRLLSINFASLVSRWLKPNFVSATALIPESTLAASDVHKTVTINSKKISGPKTNQQLAVQKQQEDDLVKITNLLKEKNLNPSVSFTSVLNSQFTKEVFKAGDLNTFFQAILAYSEVIDSMFGIFSRSMKLSESVYMTPNPDLNDAFKQQAGFEALSDTEKFFNKYISSNNTSSIMDSVQRYFNLMKYKFLVPAAPTAVLPFYTGDASIATKTPLRAIAFPNLFNPPPVNCNIFFPNQVTEWSLSENWVEEPTRTAASMTIPYVTGSLEQFLTPICVVPDLPGLEITPDPEKAGDDTHNLIITQEEAIRGVKVKRTQFNGTFLLAFQDIVGKGIFKLDNKEDTSKPTISDGANAIKNDTDQETALKLALEAFTTDAHLKFKLGSHSCNASVEWSPYRMIGLPGIILDEAGPAIEGILSSIQTTIAGTGTAISSITLKYPRTLNIHESSDFNRFEGSTLETSKYLINDFTVSEISPVDDLLFNTNLYGFNAIGTDIYTYLTQGISNQNHGFSAFTDDGEALEEDKTGIDALNKKTASKSDYSLLYYNKQGMDGLINENDTPGVENTKTLFVAAQELLNSYKRAFKLNSGSIASFVNSVNKRQVITKAEYFKFLGVENNGDSSEYKDLKTLISDDIVTKANLDKELEPGSSNDELFRPYDIVKKSHIVRGVKR